jgi:hypothetical protein
VSFLVFAVVPRHCACMWAAVKIIVMLIKRNTCREQPHSRPSVRQE